MCPAPHAIECDTDFSALRLSLRRVAFLLCNCTLSMAMISCWAWSNADEVDVDFERHIIPTLTKAGCNSGACHGAAAGRGGFRLSLLGSNPEHDYRSIVHEYEGRRTNLARPTRSLVLTKPSCVLDHGGDFALPEDSQGYSRLLRWIRSGANRGKTTIVSELQVKASSHFFPETESNVSVSVRALYSDGTHADVTPLVLFVAADSTALQVTERSDAVVVSSKRSGQHPLIARYMNKVASIQFMAPFRHDVHAMAKPNPTEKNQTSTAEGSFIDREVNRTLSQLHIAASPPTSGMQWTRRVTLDLIGRLPTLEDLIALHGDDSASARADYVDRLLASDAFNDYWTLRLSKLLNMHSLPNDGQCVAVYASWLKQSLADRVGWNKIACELITATGDSHSVGAANFSRMASDARDQAERFGHAFMGVQIGCAHCHNHPLDRWTQDDFHGLAAVFAKLDRGKEVRLVTRGAVTNVRTGEPATPRLPGFSDIKDNSDARRILADWLTASDNPYFAKAMANRLWASMFGRGLVDPVQDLRDTNLPTHPALLTQLADDFVAHGYQIRHTLRLIALSETYSRSDQTSSNNGVDDRFYSRSVARPLLPEVILDAIADVTRVPNRYKHQQHATRAIQLVDPLQKEPSLDALGRCNRIKGCDGDSTSQPGLATQLHLMNGPIINDKIIDADGRLRHLVDSGMSDEGIVTEFSIRARGESPNAAELSFWKEKIATSDRAERIERLEDFVWSMLNSRGFLENH